MALIEREELKICKHGNGYGYCFLHEEYCTEGPCDEEELVEYAPVVHGRWICDNSDSSYQYHCSVCKKQGRSRFDSYCPNCGCKMDGGEGYEAN